MSEPERSSQPSRKSGGARLAELGPAWIASLGSLIAAVTGVAGFFAGRVTATPGPAAPSQVITRTVTPPAPGLSSGTAGGAGSTAGNGTPVAAYSFQLTSGYSAPLGLAAPAQPQMNPVSQGGVAFDVEYFEGVLEASDGERIASLPSGTAPSYQACAADTVFVPSVPANPGASLCIIETSGHLAGVTVTAVNGSPSYVALKIALWKHVT